jgi:predicted PP-loop superfamily ATPase
MDNYKRQEEEEAKEAIRKIASARIQPYLEKAAKKAERKLSDLAYDGGLDDETLKKIAGTVGALGAIGKGELEGGFDIDENTRVEGRVSPREQAIRLLYNQRF